ncbi:hypothetical protein FE784_34070 [Paenibacillus hemerocallicola]|uniref:Uncharacterized protein n=1 Tax=Paenibacillus hemerocallicola TaxID=1172614 RepID=A0A5C4SYB3_9BACL|nr:hypothetical protein [Paenibacillus hemerocallicola]TNJ61572.1 hypothetical protein FE784_34070 [Paenibacillus hemerocallicola]
MNQRIITEEDMIREAELFQNIYPIFAEEMDRVEAIRGRLNDFQIMIAASRAKDAMGILSWERRQIVNAIFESYMEKYSRYGRQEADEWVIESFGCRPSPRLAFGDKRIAGNRETDEMTGLKIEGLSRFILEKEAELLQLYRELFELMELENPKKPDHEA